MRREWSPGRWRWSPEYWYQLAHDAALAEGWTKLVVVRGGIARRPLTDAEALDKVAMLIWLDDRIWGPCS